MKYNSNLREVSYWVICAKVFFAHPLYGMSILVKRKIEAELMLKMREIRVPYTLLDTLPYVLPDILPYEKKYRINVVKYWPF